MSTVEWKRARAHKLVESTQNHQIGESTQSERELGQGEGPTILESVASVCSGKVATQTTAGYEWSFRSKWAENPLPYSSEPPHAPKVFPA